LTVRDLIEKLRAFPDDTPVVLVQEQRRNVLGRIQEDCVRDIIRVEPHHGTRHGGIWIDNDGAIPGLKTESVVLIA